MLLCAAAGAAFSQCHLQSIERRLSKRPGNLARRDNFEQPSGIKNKLHTNLSKISGFEWTTRVAFIAILARFCFSLSSVDCFVASQEGCFRLPNRRSFSFAVCGYLWRACCKRPDSCWSLSLTANGWPCSASYSRRSARASAKCPSSPTRPSFTSKSAQTFPFRAPPDRNHNLQKRSVNVVIGDGRRRDNWIHFVRRPQSSRYLDSQHDASYVVCSASRRRCILDFAEKSNVHTEKCF